MLKNITGTLIISLAVAFLFLPAKTFALSTPLNDTIPTTHRLTEAAFIHHYGKTDTARALIKFYFLELKSSRPGFIISGLGIGAGAYGLHRISRSTQSGLAFFLFLALMVAVAVVLFYLGILLVLTGVRLIKFSRKKLLRQLQALQTGKALPRWILRHNAFKVLLKKERTAIQKQ